MSDIWISNLKVCFRDTWTDEQKKEIGELVLKKLHNKWTKKGGIVKNFNTEITIGTS